MRIFIDTNVFLEYLQGRNRALEVRTLLDEIEDNEHQAFISTSSLCTIAYYVELSLKELGIHKPEKTEKTRSILNSILQIAEVIDITHHEALQGINDLAFSDFEDSLQYQCAMCGRCDVIVTFNVKDYKNSEILVVTPKMFLERFRK